MTEITAVIFDLGNVLITGLLGLEKELAPILQLGLSLYRIVKP